MPRGRPAKELVRKAVEEVVEQVTREVEAEGERVPGKIVRGAKTAWTDADLVKAHGLTTFTPEETIPVTINGVGYQLIADYEITVPRIVKQIYDEHRKRARSIGAGLAALGITKEGEGGLPPNL